MTVILTNFIPKRREISAVSNATRAVVTTTENHGYSAGQVVRLIVPSEYGMSLFFVVANILSIPTDTTFVTDIDTSNQSSYVAPTPPPGFTQSQVVPISGIEQNNTSITG